MAENPKENIPNDMALDIILNSVKELQQEKVRLEQKLQDVRSRRQKFERTADALSSKYTQVKDVHTKMSETLKVAQHKVGHTQNMVEVVTGENDRLRNRLNVLQSGIKQEEEKQINEINGFQDILSNLSNEMSLAAKFHTKENLMSEINKTEPDMEECGKKSLEYSQQHADICTQIQNLKLEEDEKHDNMAGVTVPEQLKITKLVKNRLSTLQKCLDELNTEFPTLVENIHREEMATS